MDHKRLYDVHKVERMLASRAGIIQAAKLFYPAGSTRQIPVWLNAEC
jgi:hypothetical protein